MSNCQMKWSLFEKVKLIDRVMVIGQDKFHLLAVPFKCCETQWAASEG